MSLRRKRKGIPKNTNYCRGCKHRRIVDVYEYESDTNAYYVSDQTYVCTLENLTGDKDAMDDYVDSMRYSTSEGYEEEFNYWWKVERLGYGEKICGKYLHKPKKTGHWKKAEPVRTYISGEIGWDEDDIPF